MTFIDYNWWQTLHGPIYCISQNELGRIMHNHPKHNANKWKWGKLGDYTSETGSQCPSLVSAMATSIVCFKWSLDTTMLNDIGKDEGNVVNRML
jgi:hypothetical protein